MAKRTLITTLFMLTLWSLSFVHADKTWEVVWQSTPHIEGMSFADNMNGWIITSKGLLHSKDGGKNWELLPNPPPLYKIFFIDKKNGWSIGEGIYHTQDGGKTWQQQKRGMFYHAHFLDAQKGWVVGSNGSILHTTDGGETWQWQESKVTGNLSYVRFSDENHGWIYGMIKPPPSDMMVLHTKDGGKTWKIMVRGNRLLLAYPLARVYGKLSLQIPLSQS